MDIQLNGEPYTLVEDASSPATVATLLELLKIEAARGVAVALDDAVVPRSAWADTPLTPGARVEIIRPVQGG